MSVEFCTAPAVFAVNDEYQIMLPVKNELLMWVEVGGEKYFDEVNGIIRSSKNIHKFTVPMSELDKAGGYDVCYRKVIERKQGVQLKNDEYIISVQCWILNLKKEILLTKRKSSKINGGIWEPTGGIVISGENSIQAIKRELYEEIGIEVSENEISLLKEIIDEKNEVNFFRDIYILKKDISINELVFNDGEVVDAKYVSIAEFERMLDSGETFKWLKYFVDLYKNIV